jgi:hypothetical protein
MKKIMILLALLATLVSIWIAFVTLNTSASPNGAPAEYFSGFLRSSTPLAKLYHLADKTMLIAGLPTSNVAAKCPETRIAELGTGPASAEINLFRFICTYQNGHLPEAKIAIGQLLAASKIDFQATEYDYEYIAAARGRAPQPTEILSIIALYANEPYIDFTKIKGIIDSAEVKGVLTTQEATRIGQLFEAGSKPGSERDFLPLVTGLTIQLEEYRKCATVEPCKTYFATTDAKFTELKTRMKLANEERFLDKKKLFFFSNLGPKWLNLQVALISSVPILRGRFEQNVLETSAGRHYRAFFNWTVRSGT